MTLTADDVLNQKFTITKFRDGYDLDQVDDFLDSIVDQFKAFEEENAALTSQVAELTSKLEESQAKLEEAEAAAQSASAAAVENAQETQAEAAQTELQPAADAEVSPDALKSSAMLQLALELHDKYVREGEEKKNELIATGEKTADELVSEAQKQRADELNLLNTERKDLEGVIEELRMYESEYRTTLRSYIEAQLKNLDVTVGDKITPENI